MGVNVAHALDVIHDLAGIEINPIGVAKEVAEAAQAMQPRRCRG